MTMTQSESQASAGELLGQIARESADVDQFPSEIRSGAGRCGAQHEESLITRGDVIERMFIRVEIGLDREQGPLARHRERRPPESA